MVHHGTRAAAWFGVFGVALTVLYALSIAPSVSSACLVGTAVGSCIALVTGMRLHRPRERAPWTLIAVAAVTFLVGVLVRPWASSRTGVAAGAADVFTLAGYAMLIAGLSVMLRRRGQLERHALTDGIIVCLGASLLATIFLALPAARFPNRPPLISLAAGLYPMIDVILLLLVLNLGFSTASRLPSFRLIAMAMTMMFVADLSYAWIGAQGRLTGSALMDLPFLLTYTCFGVAALHPTMVSFSMLTARPVQEWSIARLALIVPALSSPLVVIARGTRSPWERSVLVGVSAALIVAILVRAVSAVRSHARIQTGLQYQATHDALTQLPNRVLLSERLNTLVASPPSGDDAAWLLFLDLDGFKLINDHWGHETGDLLLVEIARRLNDLTGPEETVARISGDEFVIIGVGGADRAAQRARAVESSLAQPVDLPGLELTVTASLGTAVQTDQHTADELLRDADMAMYRAKAAGRNCTVPFDSSMRQHVRDRVEIELALRHAIVRGQLWMAYQPITDTVSQRTVGAEALLRWTHPVRGPISPAEFIPIAEETGLILEIGSWVLGESLRQLAQWRDNDLLSDDFFMSVNVSAVQIHRSGLPRLVADALAEYSLDPGRLVIEITESVMMDNPDLVVDALTDLRAIGVGLSVDDFGTGYSSLSYLSRFPVTGVKIDRAFIDGLGEEARDEAIVRAVIAMANALGLSVVAEGVETEPQRSILARLGIERGQGWLWGAAVCGEDFESRHLAMLHAGAGNSNAQ